MQNTHHQQNIALHYDRRHEENRLERKKNAIYRLKMLNNLLKRSVIVEALATFDNSQQHPILNVVDLCGGKAGDLHKYLYYCQQTNQRLCYLVLDISRAEIERAERRFRELSPQQKSVFVGAFFVCVDVCDLEVVKDRCASFNCFNCILENCHIVSCQFALHYAYESEAKAQAFWRTVSFFAPKVLILSHPTRQRVVEWCRAFSPAGGRITLRQMQPLDNAVCGIRFADPQLTQTALAGSVADVLEKLPSFGACYHFTLRDAIDQCPEFLMPNDAVLHRHAKQFANLDCAMAASVDQLLAARDNVPLLRSTRAHEALDEAASTPISADEYQVCCLYRHSIYTAADKAPHQPLPISMAKQEEEEVKEKEGELEQEEAKKKEGEWEQEEAEQEKEPKREAKVEAEVELEGKKAGEEEEAKATPLWAAEKPSKKRKKPSTIPPIDEEPSPTRRRSARLRAKK